MDSRERLIQLSEGMAVQADVLGIVEKIRDYDSNLRVKFLNDYQRNLVGDAPYAIFELCPDGIERLVFTVWQLDDRILERLYQADNARHAVFDKMTQSNDIVKAMQERRYKERNLEIVDVMKHAFSSPKGKYSFELDGKRIELDDDPKAKAKVTPVEKE